MSSQLTAAKGPALTLILTLTLTLILTLILTLTPSLRQLFKTAKTAPTSLKDKIFPVSLIIFQLGESPCQSDMIPGQFTER